MWRGLDRPGLERPGPLGAGARDRSGECVSGGLDGLRGPEKGRGEDACRRGLVGDGLGACFATAVQLSCPRPAPFDRRTVLPSTRRPAIGCFRAKRGLVEVRAGGEAEGEGDQGDVLIPRRSMRERMWNCCVRSQGVPLGALREPTESRSRFAGQSSPPRLVGALLRATAVLRRARVATAPNLSGPGPWRRSRSPCPCRLRPPPCPQRKRPRTHRRRRSRSRGPQSPVASGRLRAFRGGQGSEEASSA